MVQPIAEALGATHSVGTKMEIIGGRYSGEIEFYCYGEQKAVAAKELAAERGYDLSRCHGYSDSSTDLPLLEVVGNPHAVNPDRALRKVATERGWPILSFARPIPIRNKIPPPIPAVAATLGAVAAAGITWYGLSRLKRNR